MNLPDLNLFQRNFASIVISPNKVIAVKLNSAKNKLEIAGKKNIPPGVIMNYRVKDKETLTNAIATLWKELKIKDRFVGVVVPEFATYTKIIEIPKIADSEIHEALIWRVEEFLPASLDEVVVDWKIIKRDSEKIEVLVVAILKDILTGYIDTVGGAGLSPLVVETPSLSIDRITNGDNQGKLTVYVNGSETLLVITKGHRIIASSVVSADTNIVVTTGMQMLSHYDQVSIEKVLLAGVGINQDLISNLHYNLGRPVQFLDYKLKGTKPADIQEYLLGISLQHKDPAEPESNTTINLLPHKWADSYQKKLKSIKIWTLTLIFSIMTWATFLTAFIVMTVISFQVESFNRGNNTAEKAEYNNAIAQVTAANRQATKVINISSNTKSFQEIFNLIYSLKTDGITINSSSVNMENGNITVSGVAAERSNLIDFKNALELNEDIGSIDFPLPNLLQQNNINFEFQTIYKPLFEPPKQNIKLNI